jgi:hypothetical protein
MDYFFPTKENENARFKMPLVYLKNSALEIRVF